MSIIAGIQGILEAKMADSVIIKVGNGVLLQANVPSNNLSQLPEIGENAKLLTHLIVREDDLQLYGFTTEQGRKLFQMLISVSQVGPKAALAVLSALEPSTLATAIISSDSAAISQAQGVGKRTAERIILELKEKLETEVENPLSALPQNSQIEPDAALQWLLALGYSGIEARQALSVEKDPNLSTDDRVKRALQRMGSTE